MSNALAIASVTFTLVDLLNNGLIDRDISASLGDVVVTALPPDRVDLANLSTSQLNLFLYQVTPNQGWRNVGLPSRDTVGNRINDNPLALDLHYLLTAYGAQPFHSEILLGYGMQLLHETPVLPRDTVRRSLAGPTQVSPGGSLPDALRNLFTSQLSEQVEMVKIWPETITTEEISRMWTAFGAHFRPTAAYHVSVVLIDSTASAKLALPVRSRAVKAIPFQSPTITQVLSQASGGGSILPDRAILTGDNLVLQGSQLKGEDTVVLLAGIEITPPDTNVSSSQIIVAIPASVPAGTQTVQVAQRVLLGSSPTSPPVGVPHRVVESDVATFVLRPQIQTITATGITGSGSNPRSGNLNLTVQPAVAYNQQARVLLNQIAPISSPPLDTVPSYSFVVPPRINLQNPPATPPSPTNNLIVPFTGVAAGNYLVRVVVDGAESPLTTDAHGVYNAPQVSIP
jgi:hypothetical protein